MKARTICGLALALVAGGWIVGAAIAADEPAKPNLGPGKFTPYTGTTKVAATETKPGKDVKCPISGKDVNPDATVSFEDCKVYLCCNNCPKAWAADTDHAKYGAKAHHQMVQTKQLKQVACPFSGKPVDEAKSVEIKGVKVAFCCDNCKGKVEKAKDDDARVTMVFKDTKKGFKLAKDAEANEKK